MSLISDLREFLKDRKIRLQRESSDQRQMEDYVVTLKGYNKEKRVQLELKKPNIQKVTPNVIEVETLHIVSDKVDIKGKEACIESESITLKDNESTKKAKKATE